MQSLKEQTYQNYTLIVSCENREEFLEIEEYLKLGINSKAIYVFERPKIDCFFNLYLNNLKSAMAENSWGLILDSDNYLFVPNSLQRLSEVLTDPNEIHIIQFVRRGKNKPSDAQIGTKVLKSGHCDSASICFHVKQSQKANFDSSENADYKFILQMTNTLPSKWHQLRVVETDRRSRGK